MSETERVAINHLPPQGMQPAFTVLELDIPEGEGHTVTMSHMHGATYLSVFHPTPELLAALHAATAPFCTDGKCPCFAAGEEAEREEP